MLSSQQKLCTPESWNQLGNLEINRPSVRNLEINRNQLEIKRKSQKSRDFQEITVISKSRAQNWSSNMTLIGVHKMHAKLSTPQFAMYKLTDLW